MIGKKGNQYMYKQINTKGNENSKAMVNTIVQANDTHAHTQSPTHTHTYNTLDQYKSMIEINKQRYVHLIFGYLLSPLAISLFSLPFPQLALVSQDIAVGDKVMAKDALISSKRSRGDSLPGGVNRLDWLLSDPPPSLVSAEWY